MGLLSPSTDSESVLEFGHGSFLLLCIPLFNYLLIVLPSNLVGRDSSVGTATRDGGDIFRTRSDRPSVHLSLQYNRYIVSFPGIRGPERGVNHPP
jgi:hypothetical protein